MGKFFRHDGEQASNFSARATKSNSALAAKSVRARAAASVLAVAFLFAACTPTAPPAAEPAAPEAPGQAGETPGGAGAPTGSGEVNLVTTNSFSISDEAKAAFEAQTGYTLNVLPLGSAGELSSQLVLTRDHPLGDAFFGVDNTFASRLLDNDVVAQFHPSNLSDNAIRNSMGDGHLTPITQGDVCLNVDSAWFESHSEVAKPTGFTDLLAPELRGKTVLLNPTTSSPGMAFMLATVAKFGDFDLGTAEGLHSLPQGAPGSWQEYWELLLANDAIVVDSWTLGYNNDFSGSGGGGTRPIVISYASSPAYTPNADATASTTAALLDTCFLQVEFAGVLNGAANPSGAQALIEFMSGPEFQSEIPGQMWVYPIDTDVELPAEWANFTVRPDDPMLLGSQVIEENRERWLEQWLQIALN